MIVSNDGNTTETLSGIALSDTTDSNVTVDTDYNDPRERTPCQTGGSATSLAPGEFCYIYLQANQTGAVGVMSTRPTLTVSSGSASAAISMQFQNNLYIGMRGSDTDNAVYTVTKYDGTTYTGLGPGPIVAPFNNWIRALAVDSDGDLIAGGEIQNQNQADGNQRIVARWNGAVWRNLGSGPTASPFNAAVDALATDNSNNVYVGGYFDEKTNGSYNPDASYIAKYDESTSTWTRFSPNITMGTCTSTNHAPPGIYSLLVYGTPYMPAAAHTPLLAKTGCYHIASIT